MTEHFDSLETREPAEREADLLARLRATIAHARAHAPYYAERLAAVDPESLTDRQALAELPVTRKSELLRLQAEQPPFAGLAAIPAAKARRVFVSPGPIYELQGEASEYGRTARALFAAGFRPGELVYNCFAYHLTPGGWIMDEGARALGCPVVAGGVGNSEQQVAAIAHLRPAGYTGTPDYLKTLLDKGGELGLDLSSITKALVSGGALFPSLRAEYAGRGVAVLQCYATAELGVVAYETEAQEGLVIDEGVLVEIVRPGTGEPLPAGEVGEVVVSVFNPDLPLIRFATGDLSAILPGRSPCGRTNQRIRGWMGRADQTTKIKGMFVHPQQVAELAKRFPHLGRLRLVVDRRGESDVMHLRCESAERDPDFAARVAETLQAVTKLRGEVELVAPGSLPNDGKVIDDQRRYD